MGKVCIKNKVSTVLGLTLRYRHLSTYIWRKMFFRAQIWLTPHLSRSARLTGKISIVEKKTELYCLKEICIWSNLFSRTEKLSFSFINSEIFHSDSPSFILTGAALGWMFLPLLYYLASPQNFWRNSTLKVVLSYSHCLAVSLSIKQTDNPI